MANDLEIRIGAELTEIKGALASLRKDLLDTGQQGRRAGRNATGGFDGLERTINRATTALAGFVSVYSGIAALRGIAAATDEFARLNSQLRLATGSQDEFVTAQKEVIRIAQETRAPVGDVANTYATIARATEGLGVSQESLVRVLETVNKSIALTPVSAETAAASLTQFGQALAGNFQAGAQELNSILEQTPGLAEAIADGLGVPTSALKKMGEEGELSAELVINALQKVSEEVDRKFIEVPRTASSALTQLRNDLVLTLGQADASGLVSSIDELRATLTDPNVMEGILTVAQGIITLTSVAAEAVSEFGELGNLIGATFADLTGNLSPLDEINIKIREIDRAMNNSVLGKPLKFLFTSPEELKALRDELEAEREAILATMGLQEQQPGESAEQRAARLRKEAEARMAAAKAAREQQAADEAAEKAAKDRQKQIEKTLDGLIEEAATYGKSAEDVVAYKLSVLGASDAEIQRAVALTRAIEALKAKEKAEKDATKAAAEAKKLEEQLAREVEQVRVRTLEAAGSIAEATRLRLESQFRELIAGLEKAGNTAGVDLVRNLINTETARAQFEELKTQFDRVVSDLQARQEALANQVTIGTLTPAVADQAQQEAREAAIAQLQRLTEQMQALALATNDPAIAQGVDAMTAALQNLKIEGLSGLDRAIADLRASLAQMNKQFAANATNAGVDALTGFFTDIASGSKSAGDALRDFVRNFALSMAQIAARALATWAVLQTLQFIPGGSAVLAAMDATASVQHGGGMAGTGPRRKVNPLLFAGAPRYHSGGMVGLKPDERPAILQTGEEVLSRQDPRNQANGGGGYRIVNVVDPSMAGDYIESAAGERAILNVITRNGTAVRQAIGG